MRIAPPAGGAFPGALTGPTAAAATRQSAAALSIEKTAAAYRAEVSADAAQVRQAPVFDAQESRKAQARAKLQQVRDWVKVMRKLFAQNPQGMAKALAQAFKDLKAAVQAY